MSAVIDALARHAASNPGGLALLANRRGRWVPTSWGELDQRVRSVSAGLAARGVGPGSTIANLVGVRAEWLYVDLAAQMLGATIVAVPQELADDQLAAVLDQCRPHTVVVDHTGVLQRASALSNAEVRISVDDVIDGVDLLDTLLDNSPHSGGGEASAKLGVVSSGLKGHPKIYTHDAASLAARAQALASQLDLGPQDVGVAAQSLAHPFERTTLLYPLICAAGVVAIPESSATVTQAIAAVQPTYVHANPHLLRALATAVQQRLAKNKGLKRAITSGLRAEPPAPASRALVARPILKSVGLNRARNVIATGLAIPDHVAAFWRALGLPLASGFGTAAQGGLVSLSDESLTRFRGIGGVEEGVQPSPNADEAFEHRLRSSRYIAHASTQNGETIVAVDESTVGEWASNNGVAFTTYESLVRAPKVQELIQQQVAAAAGGSATPVTARVSPRPFRVGNELSVTGGVAHHRVAPADARQPTTHP